MRIITNTVAALAIAVPSIAAAQNAATATSRSPKPTAASSASTVLGGLPPKIFYACYIPSSGVTYRIKEVDIKQTCAADHVMFSWTDGGVPGPQGPKGDPGPQGPAGPQGDPGTSGFTETKWVGGDDVTIAAGSVGSAQVSCPAGWVMTGGGYAVSSYSGLVPPVVTASRPAGPDIWTAALAHTSPGASGSVKFSAQAICAK